MKQTSLNLLRQVASFGSCVHLSIGQRLLRLGHALRQPRIQYRLALLLAALLASLLGWLQFHSSQPLLSGLAWMQSFT